MTKYEIYSVRYDAIYFYHDCFGRDYTPTMIEAEADNITQNDYAMIFAVDVSNSIHLKGN